MKLWLARRLGAAAALWAAAARGEAAAESQKSVGPSPPTRSKVEKPSLLPWVAAAYLEFYCSDVDLLLLRVDLTPEFKLTASKCLGVYKKNLQRRPVVVNKQHATCGAPFCYYKTQKNGDETIHRKENVTTSARHLTTDKKRNPLRAHTFPNESQQRKPHEEEYSHVFFFSLLCIVIICPGNKGMLLITFFCFQHPKRHLILSCGLHYALLRPLSQLTRRLIFSKFFPPWAIHPF